MEREIKIKEKELIVGFVIAGIIVVLTIAVLSSFINASNRTGKIILPGGVTYTRQGK